MINEDTASIILKKQYFIKSRLQDIRNYYQFFPKFLGRGAYGIVYKAKLKEAPYSQRVVKIIPKSFLKNPESLINEIQILKKLDHPNIIKLYETFEDQENYYLVQDYCQGGQLFQRLEKNGKFSQQNARTIFTQIIKILKYLHSQKISHRDLKPQNFLMNSSNSLQIKLIDFGLSFQYQTDMKAQLKQKNKHKILGTSYYIAPEVLQLSYDERCDIWSAGVLLYILVTATPPFDGPNDTQILNNISKLSYSLEIPPAKKLSPHLRDLIKKILVPVQNRMTLERILNHPWMTMKVPQECLQIDFGKLKKFSNFSKLKKIAVTYIASQIPQKQIHELGMIFKQIDENNDGYLTVDQLKLALQKQQERTSFVQLKRIIQTIDTDKNGKINYNEFVACCLQNSILNNEMYLQYVFKSFDKDHSGTISKKQFKDILQTQGVQDILKIGSFIDDLIQDCDKDHDGQINYREFLDGLDYKK